MPSKLLLETLRTATNGHVEVSIGTAQGLVRGIIEESFFQEFTPNPQTLSPARKARIVSENSHYLEDEATRQLQQGLRQVVIR